jgi:hypothetical protein
VQNQKERLDEMAIIPFGNAKRMICKTSGRPKTSALKSDPFSRPSWLDIHRNSEYNLISPEPNHPAIFTTQKVIQKVTFDVVTRTYPTATIEDFFAASAAAPPTAFESLSSTKQPLVIHKLTPEKKVKRITISGLSNTSPLPESDFDGIRLALSDGISSIFAADIDAVNFARLYHNVEYYCRFHNPHDLLDLLTEKMGAIIELFRRELSIAGDLEAIASNILKFEISLTHIRKICFYFDRCYIFANRPDGFASLPELVHDLLRKQLLDSRFHLDLILSQLSCQLNVVRSGQIDSGSAIKTVLEFLTLLNLYDELAEPMILEQTHMFYSLNGHFSDFHELLGWFSEALGKEQRLSADGVKLETIQQISAIARKLTLEQNMAVLFGPDFGAAIDAFEVDNIALLYSFFDGPEDRQIFCDQFSDFYVSKISALLAREVEIEAVIEEYSRARDFLAKAFPPESPMSGVLRAAFVRSCAPKSDRIAKQLAVHFNTNNPMSQDEIEFFRLNPAMIFSRCPIPICSAAEFLGGCHSMLVVNDIWSPNSGLLPDRSIPIAWRRS